MSSSYYPGLDLPLETRKIRGNHLSLSIYPNNRIVLRIPPRVTKKMIHDFLIERRAWTKEKTESNKKSNPTRAQFLSKEVYPIFGKDRSIEWSKPTLDLGQRTKKTPILEDHKLILIGTENQISDRRFESGKSQLKSLLMNEVDNLIKQYEPLVGSKVTKVRIRVMKSLWGTCYQDRSLTFNLALVFCPNFVIRYVVAHEMSHIKYPNHSSDFWKTVHTLDARYEKAEEWIRSNGPKTLCYLL